MTDWTDGTWRPDVPEGQVPRDAAFWATHHAVEAEFHRAWTILECEREGHEIEYGVLSEEPRCRCGMTPLEIARQHEARGMGRLTMSDDGSSFTFEWGLR